MNQGIKEQAAEVMIDSLAPATLKQYQGSLKLWWSFCEENKVNFYRASSADVVAFLDKRFKEGANYSTLNSTRAAITLVSCQKASEDGLVSRYMKGVFRNKPTKPKYASTWDPEPVLDYLKKLHPIKELKPKEVAEKVVTLLALTTAHRLQTMALINIKNIQKTDSGIIIKIPELIKTSKPGSFQPELILPFFEECPQLCVASTVLEYLEYTKELRGHGCENLLLATVRPHGPVSAQTIGHWIKSLLQKAGIDMQQFTAYTTRHSAVSSAFRRGVDIDTIRRTAGWTAKSKVFSKFYNKPIQPANNSFALSVVNTLK